MCQSSIISSHVPLLIPGGGSVGSSGAPSREGGSAGDSDKVALSRVPDRGLFFPSRRVKPVEQNAEQKAR